MIGIRRVLRLKTNGMRAMHLATKPATPMNSANLGSIAQLQRWRHIGGDAGDSDSMGVLAVGAALVAMTAVSGGETMCESLEGDDEPVYNLCDDSNNDSMAIYFDAEYEPKKLLGSGTFGVVMQCVHKQTGRVAAVKMVQDIAGNQEEVEREKQALERLERAGGHENVVGYEGSYYHNDFHYIVLEYVSGISLHSFMEKHRALDATWSLQLVSQLASALQFMYQADVVHRDLKPENIMTLNTCDGNDQATGANVTLKIIDFGSAGLASHPNKARTTALSGTRCYWPPEVLQHQDMTAAMDMWALGCILYILIAGRHPFDLTGCSTEDEILQRIKTEPVSFLLPGFRDVGADTKELIRGLLEKDPRHRLSADQVLEHPAIVEATKES